MSLYTLYPLRLGTITRDKSNMTYMKNQGRVEDYPVIAWYVTDGSRKIVVDTGGSVPGERYQPYVRPPDQELDAQLARLGVDCGEITDVILTHLHWDHAGSNHFFKNATFYAQKAELQYAVAPLEIQRGSYDIPLLFKTEYTVLDGDQELFEGLSVIVTPGHSPGSQCVLLDTERGPHLLAGDLFGLYECYESKPMLCSSFHTDLVAYYDSLARVARLGARVFPGHEPRVFDRPSYPDITE